MAPLGFSRSVLLGPALGGLLSIALAGCSLFDRAPTMTSLDAEPVSLELSFVEASYVVQASETSMLFSDVTLYELLNGPPETGSVLHAQILWGPKPGYTPVDPTATNVTLRWIVFSGGEVGVYGGAGFCWPSGKLGKGDYSISIEASTLSLIASTPGFVDLASPASITGTFSATFEPERAIRLRQAVSQLVTDAIGRPYWVDASRSAEALLAVR
ncbi:MAG: hypothetical protein ACO3SJ_04890 [Phycisphaerales bacterium]|jgi:hypothetical protein